MQPRSWSGFTPSGEDVLGGFLATYNSFAESVGRTPITLEFDELQHRTSWISARLLDYMQHLVLDEQVNYVMRYVTQGDSGRFILALQTLFPRGHTSGIDISVGVLLALGLLRDFALHTRETEQTADRLGL